MRINNVEISATTEAAIDAAPAYRSPELHVVGSAVKLVQGGGGGSGSDCRAYYYYQSGPYGC